MSALVLLSFRSTGLTQRFRIDMVSDVFNRIVASVAFFFFTINVVLTNFTHALVHVMPSASVLVMPKETSTRVRACALIDVWRSSSK
jgi:hypothetical protein